MCFAEGACYAFLSWYDPQIAGAKTDLYRGLNSFKVMPESNPLQEMGRTGDLAANMRTAGLALDDIMYTIVSDALHAEYKVEARTPASHDDIGREEVLKGIRERHHRLHGNKKKGPSAGHAMYAGDGAGGGR